MGDPDPLASGLHGLVWVRGSHYKSSSANQVHHLRQGQTKDNSTFLIPSTKKHLANLIFWAKKKKTALSVLFSICLYLSFLFCSHSFSDTHTHTSTNKSLLLKKPWLQRTDWETLPRVETATLLTDSNSSIQCSHPYKKKDHCSLISQGSWKSSCPENERFKN